MADNKTKKWFWPALGLAAFLLVLAAVLVIQKKNAGWQKIGESSILTYYIDRSSIVKSNDNATAWMLADNKEAQKEGDKSYLSSRQQFELDCKGEKKRLMHYVLYAGNMGKGSEVAIGDLPNNDWTPTVAGTVSSTLLTLSCKPWWKLWD